jgi:hypothetical protein
MKKDRIITPMGLKGREINERMKELMNIQPINENTSKVVVELTKMGPDGRAYAIVRENHEHFIKVTDKTNGLVAEDFKYIGGLQNKKQEAYPSYAKAIKHLNLRFNSLAEAYNNNNEINVFLDDNLLNESGIAGFSQYQGNGFTNEGNHEGDEPLFEEETMEEEEVELTEVEKSVEDMLEENDDNETASDRMYNSDEWVQAQRDAEGLNEHRLSISRAIDKMDSIIDSLTEGKKKVYTLR